LVIVVFFSTNKTGEKAIKKRELGKNSRGSRRPILQGGGKGGVKGPDKEGEFSIEL